MKRGIIFFTVFLVVCNIVCAQNIAVTYHTDFVRNAAKPNKIKSEHTLLVINKESSEFYSPFKAAIDSLIEAMNKKGAAYEELLAEKSKLPDGYISFRIYKNYPQKGQLTFTDRVNSTNYKYTESLEKPEWKIENETKEIIGYKCQKATGTFRGRVWTAWFTKDIPVQDGPWKLWGLPGLILGAEDSGSLYRFTAIGLVKKDEKPIKEKQKRYITCTRNEYMKQKELYEKNPIAAIGRSKGGIKITTGGTEIKPKDEAYIDIETDNGK